MIATHNIKVNGRWYAAGDTLPEEAPKQEELVIEQEVHEKQEPVKEEVKAEKPKTSARRRTTAK